MDQVIKKIRFRDYLTFADSLKIQKVLAKRRLITPFVTIAAVTAITVMVTAFLIYTMKVGMVFGGFLLVFMGVFMIGGHRIMRNAALKTQRRVYEKACTKRTGMLAAEGITIRKNKAVTVLPWDAFEKAVELDEVVVVLKGSEALGFAKYMFDTAADWDRAKGLILNRYARSGASMDA